MGIVWDKTRVKNAMFKQGWSYSQLADKSGTAEHSAWCALHGEGMATVGTVHAWADALGLPFRELWKDTTIRKGKGIPVDLLAMEFRRDELGLSKGELAELCRWQNAKISKILNTGEAKPEEMKRLAGALGMQTTELDLRITRRKTK